MLIIVEVTFFQQNPCIVKEATETFDLLSAVVFPHYKLELAGLLMHLIQRYPVAMILKDLIRDDV